MQFFKAQNIIVYQLFHQMFIVNSLFLHRDQALPDTQASHLEILGRHQRVLVKQGNLYISSADLNDSSSLLDDLCKCRFLGRQGFITVKPLL